ncbi:MAG: hypothetical protein K2X66_15260 [Cyanobacteria bacterium]|nr:hypothetical protein [Cyanobacteriota bacterium]
MIYFGATTYTSLAKAALKALQNKAPFSRELKGHLPEDQRSFTVNLEQGPSPTSDILVVRGSSLVSDTHHGKGYRQTLNIPNVPVSSKMEQKKFIQRLKTEFQKAFTRAKEGDMVPLQDYPAYLNENIQRILNKTVYKVVNQSLKDTSILLKPTHAKKIDTLLENSTLQAQGAIQKFFIAEAKRLETLASGTLPPVSPDTLTAAPSVPFGTDYLSILNKGFKLTSEKPFTQALEGLLKEGIDKTLQTTQSLQQGGLHPDLYTEKKKKDLQTLLVTLEKESQLFPSNF